MRIITLNVNGIRSAERKGFARWLARAEPWDVVCLQEIKAHECDLPRALRAPRRSARVRSMPAQKKGYSGVGDLRRSARRDQSTGFGHAGVRRRGPLPRGATSAS